MRLTVRALWIATLFSGSVLSSSNPTSPEPFPGERSWTASSEWGNGSDASPAFTTDGRTVYFTHASGEKRTIMVSHFANGAWSPPAVAEFSGRWRDIEPAMTPDGSYLIFVSNRPTVDGGEVLNGYYGSGTHPGGGGNFWRVNRVGEHWSRPVRLPDIINGNSSTYAPAIAKNEDIYFMQPDPNTRKFRLYRSRFERGSYIKAEPLSFSDGSTSDFDPAVAADESFLIFSSNRKPAPEKHSEIFITFLRNHDWTAPIPLRPGLEGIESRLSHNGKMLYFTSDHPLLNSDVQTKPSAESATTVVQRIWQIPLAGLASFPHHPR